MLTIDTLNKNSVLSALTDEQKRAIEEMSRNDENAVISTKIGELHGRYDLDIKEVTGVEKNGGEKSYDYLKRVLTAYKGDAEKHSAIASQLEASRKEVEEWKKKAESGADEAVRKQLSDEKTRSAQLQEALTKSLGEISTLKETHETTVKGLIADNEFDKVVSGLKFKQSVTDGMKSVMIAAAKAEVLAKGEIEVQNLDDGTKRVVVRGKDGNVLNNPSNNLNPYTLSELFSETCIKDILDSGRRVSGGGTNQNPRTPDGDIGLDLSTAKTQVEADNLISEHLLKSGLTRDSAEFAAKSMELRNNAKVGDLPIK